MLCHRLLGRVQNRLGVIFGFDGFLSLLVFGRVRFCLFDHPLDVSLRESTGGLNLDALLLAGAFVLCRDVGDAVGIDIERHVDLRHAAWRRRNAHQVKLPEQLVVGSHFAFALEYADGDRTLVILGRREYLALFCRHRGVSLDKAREHSAQRFNSERQRRDIEQQDVFDIALQYAGLDCCANRNHLVRVHALVRLLAEDLLHDLLNFRHPGHTANQDYLGNISRPNSRVFERIETRFNCLLDEILDQGFEFRARQLDHKMFRTRRIRRNEWQINLSLSGCRQLDLGLLRSLLQALQSELVVPQIYALLALELIGQVIHKPHIEVFAAEESVSISGFDLEYTIADVENGYIERTATEIVDRNLALLLLLKSIGKRRSGRLIDNAQDLEASNLAGIFGGLSLRIVEIRRNRDDRLRHFLTKIRLGCFLHLLQNERRYL